MNLWELMSPRCIASLNPRDMVCRIYEGDHLMLLNVKISKLWPHNFREEDFLSFFHCKSMRANEPWDVANLNPRGMVGRIYVVDHLKLLHAVGLMISEKIFKVFPL